MLRFNLMWMGIGSGGRQCYRFTVDLWQISPGIGDVVLLL
jgi:hypothetical protein